MVQSNILPKIEYKESKELDEYDVGHNTTLYEMRIEDVPVAVVLGKPRFDKHEVFYCRLYGVGEDIPVVKTALGIVETPIENAVDILGPHPQQSGANLDVPLERMDNVLFYSFVNAEMLKQLNSRPETYHIVRLGPHTPDVPPPDWPAAAATTVDMPLGNEDEDDLFRIVLPRETTELVEKIEETIEKGVFRTKRGFSPPALLDEETHRIAQRIKAEYVDSGKHTWLQKFMHNSFYEIVDVENNGDCLFAVVREAFATIGKITDVGTLRTLVASKMTQSLFELRREIFVQMSNEREQRKRELIALKKQAKHPPTNATKEDIEVFNGVIQEYNEQVKIFKAKDAVFAEFDYMKNIKHLEDFQTYIMTRNFWADSWVISVLEKELKFKLIILGEEEYKDNSLDNVLQCGETSNDTTVTPDFYIIAVYSGNHYRLVSYKERCIFTFVELPYDVKTLVLKKCMEKNSGEYEKIPEFREWKHRYLGQDEDAQREEEVQEPVALYDPEVVFLFYDHSPGKHAPGKGPGEKIPSHLRSQFAELNTIEYWRRMLDDSWERSDGLFRLDNRQWNSVTHYMLGAQFKNGFPDIYHAFSRDSGTDISMSIELAKKSVAKKTGLVTMNGKKTKARPDLGFHTETTLDKDLIRGRDVQEREMAVRAKFDQNPELKKILKLTKPAMLMHFIRATPPEKDLVLMSLRELL